MLLADAHNSTAYGSLGVFGCAVMFAGRATPAVDGNVSNLGLSLAFAGLAIVGGSLIAIIRGLLRISRHRLPGDWTPERLEDSRIRSKWFLGGLVATFAGIFATNLHEFAGFPFFPHWQIASFGLMSGGLAICIYTQAWYLRRLA